MAALLTGRQTCKNCRSKLSESDMSRAAQVICIQTWTRCRTRYLTIWAASRNADIERCLDKILDSDISDISGYRLTDELKVWDKI